MQINWSTIIVTGLGLAGAVAYTLLSKESVSPAEAVLFVTTVLGALMKPGVQPNPTYPPNPCDPTKGACPTDGTTPKS